ncbi:MutS protein 1 [Elasticomyces elasticus]|nr:MutS protein 1 [Elasticomyces elasticus]
MTESDKTPTKAYPPVLQQHLNNVRKFKDCVVLTRVGNFYEMYFDQVEQYAPLVNLKIAKKATTLGDVSMAGFQHSQLDRYLKMFVQDLGKQVAISEQIRLPESGRTGVALYDRKVARVITPGTLIDESFVDPYENNYLLAVHVDGALPVEQGTVGRSAAHERYKRTTKVGLSWVDLSSGDFFTQISDLATLPSLVARIGPREVVLDSSMESVDQSQLQRVLGDGLHSICFHSPPNFAVSVRDWTSMLDRAVAEEDIQSFATVEVTAGSLVLAYIAEKLHDTRIKLLPPVRKSDEEYMSIDKQSLRGLEIRTTLRDSTFKGSLLHAMRHTVTKSGARLLSQRLVAPSMSLSVINSRLDLVQEMLSQDALREDIIALLRRTADTLRLLQRFVIGKGSPDDLLDLARTVDVMTRLTEVLHEHILANEDRVSKFSVFETAQLVDLACLWEVLGRLDLHGPPGLAKKMLGPADMAKDIQEAIDEESLNRQHVAETEDELAEDEMVDQEGYLAVSEDFGLEKRSPKAKPTSASSDVFANDIWIVRKKASRGLQRAHDDLSEAMQAKDKLEQCLRGQLRSESLTLKWNSQNRHFCHVKSKNAEGSLAKLPEAHAIASSKSTLTFTLPEWTQLGARLDSMKLRIREEEERVLDRLRGRVIENLMKLRRNAAVLDELDVACSSATVAKERNLVRPILNESTSHQIVGGRHPTVDVGLTEQGRPFTANDCAVGDGAKTYLITGPNMGGKSTYLRQNALITILAQTGCFVPADYAEIGLVDKIFSRIGSADNLYQDQSTFMVEMLETAEILKQATPRSFVIMDEVGRGTTPQDGIAVGYAALHHLQYVNRCRTLFATHFHTLADMTRDFEELECYCTDVAEEGNGSWAYVHKLRKGVNRTSHALKVARLAGLPESAIEVAGEVLADLQRSFGGAMLGGDRPAESMSRHMQAAVEYVKTRQIFFIDLGDKDIPETMDSFLSTENKPDEILKSVRRVHIFLSWSAVLHSAADEQYSKFLVGHGDLESLDQESIFWTPAKALRDKLRAFLGLISPLVRRDAKVVIHIDLGDFPDPVDPFTWKRALDTEAGVVSTTVTRMVHAFHLETVRGLEHDTTLEWPTPGHLQIEGMIRMPLWCSMAMNSAEVAESLRSWRQGLSDQVTLPQYEESAERVAVKLLPEVGEHSFRGYEVLMSAPYALTGEEEESTWVS